MPLWQLHQSYSAQQSTSATASTITIRLFTIYHSSPFTMNHCNFPSHHQMLQNQFRILILTKKAAQFKCREITSTLPYLVHNIDFRHSKQNNVRYNKKNPIHKMLTCDYCISWWSVNYIIITDVIGNLHNPTKVTVANQEPDLQNILR